MNIFFTFGRASKRILIRSKSKDWKTNQIKLFGASKPKVLNRIVKIDEGYRYLGAYI